MKKKIIIFLMAFSIVLCLSVLFGCSIFGKPDKDDAGTNNPPTPIEKTELQAPESVRLDMATDTLYIADCSASGVKYYKVTQKMGTYDFNLGTLDASNLTAENGYFAFKNLNIRTGAPFKLTIFCKANADDRSGASRSFEFECAGGINDDYVSDKCVFDSDTGLYSWPAVAGATGYKIEIYGADKVTVVQEPKFTVEESVNSFTVTPLYDGNKIGIPCTVSVQGTLITNIKYDVENSAFTWYGEVDYIAEITENGQTVTKTGNGKEVPYVPTTESVSIRITTLSSSRRPGVGPQVTFAVLQDNLDISLNKDTCELSWKSVEGATKYDIRIQLKGDEAVHLFRTESPSIVLNKVYVDGKYLPINGAGTVKISPITDTPTIARFSPFEFYVIHSLNELTPKITRNAESGKIDVSIPSDQSVESFKITVTAEDAQTQAVEVDCPVGAATVDAQVDLPANRLSKITVSRSRIKGGEGHYCFSNMPPVKDYSKWILYAATPQVSMRKTGKTSYGDKGILIDVKFPEQLRGKGTFNLKYEFAGKSYSAPTFNNNMALNFAALVGKNTLKVNYQSFNVGFESALLFTEGFQTEITCFDVNISANKEQIEWQSVEGAESYCVEMSDGGAYTTVYEGSDTRFAYSLTDAGDYFFRVTPCNDDPFIIGVGSKCNISKLAMPTVSISDGSLPVVSSKQADTNIVTLCDGENKELTEDNIRTALANKASVSLVARCTRSDTDTRVYVDSDDAQYTLHRIAQINDDSMGLTIDNANQSATWTAVDDTNNYDCRLYKKGEEGEFAEISVFSGSQTQMDCTDLTCGEYKLEIKPVNYSNGNDLYVYIDGAASGTFTKEGINSVGIGGGGLAFTVDGFITSATAAKATIKLSFKNSLNKSWTGNFPISDSIDISQEPDFIDSFTGVKTITFSIEYGGVDDGQLNRLNTLKCKDFVMPVTIEVCETPSFEGSYSYVGFNKAKVTLTPVYRQLKDFESYSIVYKQKDKAKDYEGKYYDKVTDISETAGNEVTFDVPYTGYYIINLFALRVTANKFTEENGEVVFYRSSGVKSNDEAYKVALTETLSSSEIYDEKSTVTETGKMKLSFKLRVGTLLSFDEYFDYGYLGDDGKWHDSSAKIRNEGLKTYYDVNCTYTDSDDLRIFEGKQIELRIRRHEMSVSSGNFDASCWYYLSVTVPPLTEQTT